jgi:CRP-like cAMP-binding protein
MSTAAELAKMLESARLFGALTLSDREQLSKELRPAAFTAGQTIFSRGDPGNEIYLVLTGRVRLSILTLEGRELSFTHAGEGDVFGEIAALDGGPRTADATAVTAVEAMILPRSAFRRLLETMPDLADAAIRFLCTRLRDADQQLEGVALHRIEVRLARYFLQLLARQQGSPAIATVPKPKVVLGISQGELALLLGASRPKVNAALMALEDTGAVTRDGEAFICNREELHTIAEIG